MSDDDGPVLKRTIGGHTEEWRLRRNGLVMAVYVPVVPDHVSAELQEGLTRLRTLGLTGTCPCGNVMQYRDRGQGMIEQWVAHSPHCAAEPGNLDRLGKRDGYSWNAEQALDAD